MLPARDNPFSTDRVLRERYRLDEDGWSKLLTRLTQQRGRGALVGPQGSGKTTLLEDLAVRLARTGRRVTTIRLSAESRRIPEKLGAAFFRSLNAADALLLDGAEQLPLLRWLRFRLKTRRAGILVVTTHRGGRLPLLRRCTTSAELLRELVCALGVKLDGAEAAALFQRHDGNLRDALRELYDRQAQSSAVSLSTGIAHV